MLNIAKTIAVAATIVFAGVSAPQAEAQVFYMKQNSEYAKADKAMRAGELDKASGYFKQAIRSKIKGDQLLAAYNNLCAVDLARGDLESAERACTLAIGESRLYWRAYINRGHVRSVMGKHALALKDIEKALQLKPNSKLAQRVLARVKEQTRLFAEVN